MASVLIVEDDHHIRSAIVRALSTAGHAVRAEGTGSSALTAALDDRPDVIVLDLGLPDLDGSQVLAMLRGVITTPVIIATARDDEGEIVRLLDAGADDYIVKPYSTDQLEARIRAVIRRGAAGEAGPKDIRVGGLLIDQSRRLAFLDGSPLELSRLEFDLLRHLAESSPAVVSRQELLAEVWRQPLGGSDKTVDVHLSWLRRKLGETAQQPRYLRTVRGVGVALAPPTGP